MSLVSLLSEERGERVASWVGRRKGGKERGRNGERGEGIKGRREVGRERRENSREREETTVVR